MELNDIKKQILEEIDPQLREEKRRQTIRGYVFGTVQIVALLAVIVIVFILMMGFAKVDGNSMNPTLHDGDLIIYRRNVGDYSAGDIVVLRKDNGSILVKRVVAVAGDTVNIQDGKIYVNGEEYKVSGVEGLTERKNSDVENPCLVGENEVFVLGDNRENSEDSRSFGTVSVDNILGKMKWYLGSGG